MPKMTKKSAKGAKAPKCVCVVMHTYEGFVTVDSWNVVTHTCIVCGIEHFNDEVPLVDLPPNSDSN